MPHISNRCIGQQDQGETESVPEPAYRLRISHIRIHGDPLPKRVCARAGATQHTSPLAQKLLVPAVQKPGGQRHNLLLPTVS